MYLIYKLRIRKKCTYLDKRCVDMLRDIMFMRFLSNKIIIDVTQFLIRSLWFMN